MDAIALAVILEASYQTTAAGSDRRTWVWLYHDWRWFPLDACVCPGPRQPCNCTKGQPHCYWCGRLVTIL